MPAYAGLRWVWLLVPPRDLPGTLDRLARWDDKVGRRVARTSPGPLLSSQRKMRSAPGWTVTVTGVVPIDTPSACTGSVPRTASTRISAACR